ncbi:MAG: hypothetical protein KDH20_06185 [Rhodocyclaceae bacterium]|nr:hypothetical protein [Rhodocyclaceae bacterium]
MNVTEPTADLARTPGRDVLWLLGDGRSGTTWLASLLSQSGGLHPLFEPFHPACVADCAFLAPHAYLRPHAPCRPLEAFARRVFAGEVREPRICLDGPPPGGARLLVKDIFANLLAWWVVARFPVVRPVLLLRHPFAVALSKARRRDWYWMDAPGDFLADDTLMADHLAPFADVIQRYAQSADFVVRQVLIWAVVNRVPLRQFSAAELPVIFHESAVDDPTSVVDTVLSRFGGRRAALDDALVNRPSMVSDCGSTLATARAQRGQWRQALASRQIDAGEEILAAFGFGDLYDREGRPNPAVLDALRSPSGGG